MPRTQKCRNVECHLQTRFYNPAGQPLRKNGKALWIEGRVVAIVASKIKINEEK